MKKNRKNVPMERAPENVKSILVNIKGEPQELEIEKDIKAIALRVVELFNAIDLPGKFTFWWVLRNANELRSFVEDVIKIIRYKNG